MTRGGLPLDTRQPACQKLRPAAGPMDLRQSLMRERRMRNADVIAWIRGFTLAMLVALHGAGFAQSGNPTNKAECLRMAQGPLERQCNTIFASDSQREQRSACLAQVRPRLEAVCEQFFGAGSDFCATCTSSCNRSFQPGDGKRRECLAMCLRQPGCQ